LLDVHAPHEAPHGARDFFLHLFTITIGLLIALSLEGLVEWQQHRHLAHAAEASMTAEIKSNAAGMDDVLTDLHKEQAALAHDKIVLNAVIQTGTLPKDSSMEITFHIRTFDDLSWRTAVSTNALAYMPYDEAGKFADIYQEQDELAASEQQAARDAAVSLGALVGTDSSWQPGKEEAAAIKEKIGTLQGQLLIVDSFMRSLNTHYTKFVAEHP
jgi:hypothetical protein